MRVRVSRRQHPTVGIHCQRCKRERFYASWEEVGFCPCGANIGTIFLGRLPEWDSSPERKLAGERRVQEMNARLAAAHDESRQSRARRGGSTMANAKVLKIRKRTVDEDEDEPVVETKGKAKRPRVVKEEYNAGRVLGRTTQMRVGAFQNLTLEQNLKKRLTDEELAKLWCREFPTSKAVQAGTIDAAMVASVRSAYNRGAHGNPEPTKKVPQYDDDGQPMPFRGERVTAAKEQAKVAKRVEKLVAEPKTAKRVVKR